MTSCLNPNSLIAKVYNDSVQFYNDSVKLTNWIIWFIQTWKFDVFLLNCQHLYMLFMCMLYVKSTVSCLILDISDKLRATSLSYFIFSIFDRLKMYLPRKADATVYIFMIIIYNYLVSLTFI